VLGKALFVPENSVTIGSVRVTNSAVVDRNITAALYKNDSLLQYFILPTGQFTVKYESLNYPITSSDVLKVSIIEGIGSNFSLTLFSS
jgi:hypothetical protein